GIGKSRLVQELLAAAPQGATLAGGRCLSYGESTSVFALDGVVRGLVGDDVPAGLAARLAGVERAQQIADRVAAAGGVGGRVGPGEEVQWAFRRLLERVAADGPVLVALDDVHWAEPWLLDLVEYLAAFAAGPILLVACARPELLDARPGWAGPGAPGELVRLEPLSGAHTHELVDAMLAGHEPPPGTAERIAERSGGNPLFAEQVVALEVERDFRAGSGLPSSLRALLQERIDNLPDHERDVLARGAVEGVVFHRGALAALADDEEAARERGAVMSLMRKGIVTGARTEHAGDDAFRFHHVLLRDAAYEALAKERRARLHVRFADWLEPVDPQRHAMLGHHRRQAWQYAGELRAAGAERNARGRRGGAHLFRAAEAAASRSALPAAAVLFRQAAELQPADAAEHVDARVGLGAARLAEGRLARAGAVLQGAEQAGRAGGHDGGAAHAAVLGLQAALELDPDPALPAVAEVTAEAARVFTASGDHLGM